jgi:exopolysaccharide production protein ExoQ
MTISFGLVILVSLSLAVIVPNLAITTHEGNNVVRGIYVHKNNAGWTSSVIMLIAYGAYRARAGSRKLSFVVILLSVISVILSRSATSILAIVIGVTTFWGLGLLRRSGSARPIVTALAIMAIITIFALAALILPLVLEAFDKTTTLSGRTTLWTALIPAIEQRPFFGWGFGGALWESDIGRDFFKYAFFAGNAQGGYTETLVNSGIVGCLILFVPYIVNMLVMFRRSNSGDRLAETFLSVLTTMTFLGITAPVFMSVNQIFWIIITSSMFYQANLANATSRTAITKNTTNIRK